MNTASQTKIAPLSLEHDRHAHGAPYNSIEFAPRSFPGYDVARLPFRVTLWNDGFEASHELSADDLILIREWIEEALAAQAKAA